MFPAACILYSTLDHDRAALVGLGPKLGSEEVFVFNSKNENMDRAVEPGLGLGSGSGPDAMVRVRVVDMS